MIERSRAPVLAVADRHRQRVSGVCAFGFGLGQQDPDHHGDLLFLGMTGAYDCFLDQIGGVFGDRQSGESRHNECYSPGLAEFQGRLRIPIDEGFLDRRFDWHVFVDHRRKTIVELTQAIGKRKLGVRMHDAARDIGQAGAILLDDAPAEVSQAGVNSYDANRSGSHIVSLVAA